MLQPNQPIYQRSKSRQQQPTPLTISPEALERKKLQHDDEWLHDHKGRNVIVVFTDGEHLEGTVSRIRVFSGRPAFVPVVQSTDLDIATTAPISGG